MPVSHDNLFNFRRGLSVLLEQLAFIALLLLALGLSFEWIKTILVVQYQGLSNIEMLQFVVIALWSAARLIRGGWRRVPIDVTIALLGWLVVLFVSMQLSPNDPIRMQRFFIRMLSGAWIAWIAFDLTRNAARWQAILRALALGGILVALLGLAEVVQVSLVVKTLIDFRGASTFVGDMARLTSTLPYTTITAMVIEFFLPLTLAWLLTTQTRWLRILLILSLLAEVLALLLTLSRGGIVAFLTGLGVMGIIAWRRGQRRLFLGSLLTAGGLLVILGLLIVARPNAALRFITENDESWYQATYNVPDTLIAHPGETLSVPVTLANTGVRTWTTSGSQPFVLGYHFARALQSDKYYEGTLTPLAADVPPGQKGMITAQVVVPSEPGLYVLKWDMLQKTVTWFSTKKTPTAETLLIVEADPGIAVEATPLVPISYFPPHATIERLTLWKVALQMALQHPLFGVGPDNFRWVYGNYVENHQWDTNLHANNLYIEWLADTGVIGLGAFLWLSLCLGRAAWRGLKRQPNDTLWMWQLALIASLTAWYVHGIVDYFYEFTPTTLAFWLIAGLAVSAAGQDRLSASTQVTDR